MKKTANAEREKGRIPEETIEFPYTYTKPKCSVRFKTYKTPRQEYDAYTLVYYQEAQRKRKLCSTFEADDLVPGWHRLDSAPAACPDDSNNRVPG